MLPITPFSSPDPQIRSGKIASIDSERLMGTLIDENDQEISFFFDTLFTQKTGDLVCFEIGYTSHGLTAFILDY